LVKIAGKVVEKEMEDLVIIVVKMVGAADSVSNLEVA